MLTLAESAAAARNAAPPENRVPPSPAKTPRRTGPSWRRLDDGEREQHAAARLEEAVESPVEQLPDGSVDAAQRLLDPVDRAEEMAALNRLAAAEPDRHVLRVAAEPRHLVRHHLADGHHEVVAVVDERTVDGEGQREAERPADDLVHLAGGELADGRHVVAPAMVQQRAGIDRVAEHQLRLGGTERVVRAERRHDVEPFDLAREQDGELRDDLPGAGVQARLVGRHEQHPACVRAGDLAREVTHERAQLVA